MNPIKQAIQSLQAKWSQVNSPENVSAFNQKMQQSMIGGGIVGGGLNSTPRVLGTMTAKQPVASEEFFRAVEALRKNAKPTNYTNTVNIINKAALEQLTPAEQLLLNKSKSYAPKKLMDLIGNRLLDSESKLDNQISSMPRVLHEQIIPNLLQRK